MLIPFQEADSTAKRVPVAKFKVESKGDHP